MKKTEYNNHFFQGFELTSYIAATKMLPIVLGKLMPESIIDFGCGQGIWEKALLEINPNLEITGIDGEYISKEDLKIDEAYFIGHDLNRPMKISKKYDLAISIEVAEHLKKESADIFVDNICSSSDNILFSAAIPYQGGTEHINEEWQSYWIKKFVSRGYNYDTSLRDYLWKDKDITPWRRQNILFFSKHISNLPLVEADGITDVVNPDMYITKVNYYIDCMSKLNIRISALEEEIKCKRWELPYEKIGTAKRIALYGYGDVGRDYYRELRYNSEYVVVCVADQKFTGTEIKDNCYFVNPIKLMEMDFDIILVGVRDKKISIKIRDYLIQLGIVSEKIIM